MCARPGLPGVSVFVCGALEQQPGVRGCRTTRCLAGHTEWFLRLGTPGGYSPERLLSRLAPTLSSPAAGVEGLHLFTFNQVQQTEQWRRALLARADG